MIILPSKRLPQLPPEKPKIKLKEDMRCVYCQGWHLRYCPRVRRISFFQGAVGVPSEVEYWSEGDFDDSATIYEDDERYDIEVLT